MEKFRHTRSHETTTWRTGTNQDGGIRRSQMMGKIKKGPNGVYIRPRGVEERCVPVLLGLTLFLIPVVVNGTVTRAGVGCFRLDQTQLPTMDNRKFMALKSAVVNYDDRGWPDFRKGSAQAIGL
jgi:hypothetical protein